MNALIEIDACLDHLEQETHFCYGARPELVEEQIEVAVRHWLLNIEVDSRALCEERAKQRYGWRD